MKKLKKLNKSYNILVSGGGTGGHIFPAIAIANELKRRFPESKFLFVGAEGRMEMQKVPAAGFEIEGLWISGFKRSLSWSNFVFPFKLIHSYFKAGKIVRQFKPDLAVGTGGFASGPALNAAMRNHIPSFIQEQNSYPGVTNKILAQKAWRIFVAYEGMEKYFPSSKLVVSGNPVRRKIIDSNISTKEGREKFEIPAHKKVILIVGGSLGSQTFNNCMLRELNRIRQEEVHVIWQTGKPMYEKCRNAVYDIRNVTVTDFIPDMEMAYAAADIIVSRAGAIAISELCVVGKPVILVPFPFAAEDHQTSNAKNLADKGAAIHIKDEDAPQQLVTVMMQLLKEDEKRASLAFAIKLLGIKNAAEVIVDEMINSLSEKNNEN
jgi:UDP-N-acetylglucosamine--N-acetylmuramyl-(pentapeptide) pyrophosphoryl-undecaprenol N-acetylglucosamine transferase